MFNRDNVSLVDTKQAPLVDITANGIRTIQGEYELDLIVFVTVFNAMTGSLLSIDIHGRNGQILTEKWVARMDFRLYRFDED